MNVPKNKVVLVVDRDFGDRVRSLSQQTHVWLIDSAANRGAAEPIWKALKLNVPEDPLAQGITLFESPSQLTPEESLADILDTLVEHHFHLTILEIYGVRDSARLRSVLAGSGFVVSSSEADHVACSRTPPSPKGPSLSAR